MNSQSSQSTKKKRSKAKKIGNTVLLVVLLACVALLVCLGLSQLFGGKETRTSADREIVDAKAMVCEATSPKDPFFVVEGATDVEHTIKVTYKNGVADKISYEYDAEVGSPEAAEQAEAKTHAAYNTYMGNYASDFSAQFMPMGTEYKISIYADTEDINSGTGRIFFISQDDYGKLADYDIEAFKQIIQTAGFRCEMDDD